LAATLAREPDRVRAEPLSAVQVRPELLAAARCPERGAYRRWCRPPEPTAARYPAALASAAAPAWLRPQ
jgi:hypothetical protein